jgi:hypothetical protein
MEIGVDSKTEVCVHLSFSWFFNPVFLVDKIPLLVILSFSLSHVDIFVFSVYCILNGCDLIEIFLVGKSWCLPFEQLEPFRVICLTSKPVASSAHGIVGPVLVPDGLRYWIECPKLGFSVLIVNLL